MLTGTPLDLTPFGVVLQAIGWVYWGLAIAALTAALYYTRSAKTRIIAVAVVIGVFGALPMTQYLKLREALQRQKAGWAHFQELCKSAGEKISRTVENVDGILLMKLRPETVDNYEQFTPDDVYGHDTGGEDYIKSFLRLTRGTEFLHRMPKETRLRYAIGYRWVEAKDLKDGQTYRYTLAYKAVRKRSAADWESAKKNEPGIGEDVLDFALERELIDRPSAKHGLTWEEISTRDDREQWVAGGVLKVIDLQTNNVIAERRGFMWDNGMGSRSGGRTPWLFSQQNACPQFAVRGESDHRREKTHRENVNFVLSVARPDLKE